MEFRVASRLASLCLQTSGVSPSPSPRSPLPPSHSLLVCPPVRFLRILPLTDLSLSSRFSFLSARLRLPSPAREKKTASLSVSEFLPTRPLPSRPLRFKSLSGGGGGGREDVNSTRHGNASATAMLNREMRFCIGTRSKISRTTASFFTRLIYAIDSAIRVFIYFKYNSRLSNPDSVNYLFLSRWT